MDRKRAKMIRFSSILFLFFTILAHAAVEHGKVFPITETAQTYNASDNSYDATGGSDVRFSYTPTKTGFCTVTTSYGSSSFTRYLYYYGTDDTFSSSYIDYDFGSGTLILTFACAKNQKYNLIVRTSSSSYYSYNFNIRASVQEVAASEKVYPLSATFVPYTYQSNSSLIGDYFAIKLSYEATTTGLHALVSRAKYSRNAYYYSTDATFASRTSFNHAAVLSRTLFSLTAGTKYYFAMYQSSRSYFDDTVSVRMAPTLKVNSDTLGSGYVYVGSNSRNYDSTYVVNDTVPLRAYARPNYRFDKWEKVSGTCSIVNPSAAQTSVVINSNCKVRAVFKPGEVYAITKTAKKYSLYKNYYSGDPSNGVRFSFVAPKAGSYIIKYAKDSTELSYLRRYATGAFSSVVSSKSVTTSIADTLLLSAGDSAFYIVSSYYNSDSMMSFSMSYDSIPSLLLTIESASARCSTSVSSIPVLKGQVAYVEAFSRKGYRPNGWTFVSGSHKFSDSTAYSIRDTIFENTKIKLRCKAANLIDITDKPKNYVANKDFYEESPNSGLRFRYVAPTSGIFVLQFEPRNYTGTYRYYGTDSTFSSSVRMYSSTANKVSFNVVAAAGNEALFASTVPYSTSNWYDSVSVVALRAGTVKVEGQTRVDTLAVGGQVALTSTLDSGAHFDKWSVVSGKGTFVDSSKLNTSFILKGTGSVVVKPLSSKLPLYELTNQYRGYTVKDNGSQSRRGYYGVRTVFNPRDTGMYVILMNADYAATMYNFGSDSTFYSQTYRSCDAGTCRLLLSLNAKQKQYFQFVPQSPSNWEDTLWVKAVKTARLNVDTSGTGYAYVGTGSRTYDSTYIAGDTVPVRAYTTDIDHRFSRWSVKSGSCKIVDSTKASTYIIPNGDCTVRAHFVVGTVYPITNVSTTYTLADNYYSRSPTYGVRFKFVAPADGQYAISIRSLDLSMTVEYYASCSFSSYTSRSTGTMGKLDQLGLLAGDSVCYIVRNYYTRDTLPPMPFWISFSQSKASLKLITADTNGTVSPANGYSPAWLGTAYPITATAKNGLRFDKWVVESGSAKIEDPYDNKTMAIPADSVTIKASFKYGSVYPLTSTKKSYNVYKHHYADTDTSTVLFRWTPQDTNHYLLHIDSITGMCTSYGTDSLFKSTVKTYGVTGSSYILLQGIPGRTYYYSIKDTVKVSSRTKDFTVQVISPNVMFVESTRGRAVPSDYVYVAPGRDTSLYVYPYGGYVFDSWVKVEGSVKIDNPSKTKTRAEPQSKYCHIKANYVFDLTTEPELSITDLDLSNHPGICAHVSVTDKNKGKPIAGLDASDFVLFQDKKSLPVQATTIQQVGGVSVAIVVDESGSMDDEIEDARNAVRQFIDGMGPLDRTAIIGFEDAARLIQPITSDRDLLYQAVNNIHAYGGTAINNGAFRGLDELVNETNPTVVIIFSDGDGRGSYSNQQIINKALAQNTTIYSIGVGSYVKDDPLKNIAEGTHGTYSKAPSASELANIYASIQSAVQARYVLCYQSPDVVWSGDTHTVVVKTKFLNKDASDTAYWDESSQPPIVELTPATWKLVGVNQPQFQSLTIDVTVKSPADLKNVLIYTRDVSLRNESFKMHEMVQVDDTLWRYVIPDSLVDIPGIDFYVVAADVHGLTGKAPAVMNPAKEPYTIPVKNDVPDISFDSIACVDTTGGKGSLRFKISDDNGVNSATLFYKDSAAVLFDERQMSESRGYWTGYIPAKVFRENGIIEYYVRAIDELGASARWKKMTNTYIPVCNRRIRMAEVEDSITIVNGETAGDPVTRETAKLRLKLVTEDFSTGKDTVTASLSCLVSGDIESEIRLAEKSSGYYETIKSIPKNEYSAKRDDGSISCTGTDTLIAEYKDPQYGTYARDTVFLSDSVEFSYRFLDAAGKKDLDSLESGDSVKYTLRLTSVSKSIHKKDTLKVLLRTDTGDSLWVKAIETENYSSVFVYKGTFYFAYDENDLEDSRLDALFDMNSSYNRVVLTAKVKGDKLGKKRDSLVVFSNYIPADIAEIYDADKDGEADSVRIHYVASQKEGVAGIDTMYWNKAGGTWRSVPKKRFHLKDDKSWVEAQLKKPFHYGATAADAKHAPYLRLERPAGGFAQKLEIKDHVGAVPAKAVKRPGIITIDEFMECSNEVPPDTLEITLSEPVKNIGKDDAWKKLFSYSEDCKDTLDYSLNIAELLERDSAGLVWTFVLGDHNIMTYNCIRTNPKATFVDMYENPMGRGGVNIDGSNGNLYLYEVAPTPPVSGLGSKEKWIAPGEHDWSRVPDTLSAIKVASIMPYNAYITIFDSYSRVVTSFQREFGENGEMNEEIRGNSKNHAKIGYLDWNHRSDKGRLVGTGVYIWRIDFKFKDGHSEFRLVKTGVKRKK